MFAIFDRVWFGIKYEKTAVMPMTKQIIFTYFKKQRTTITSYEKYKTCFLLKTTNTTFFLSLPPYWKKNLQKSSL